MPSFDEILDAADQAQPGFRKAVLAAVEDAGAAINWNAVEARIGSGQYGQALDLVAQGWESVVPGATAQVQKITVDAMDAGATVVEFSKVPGAAFTGGFTVLNPSSIHWAQTRSSTLIKAISDQQQEAVRQIITRATAGELTTQSAARIIKGTVGLDPRRAQALATFSAATLAGKEGKALAAAQKAVSKYEQRLLKQRADVIARTEALSAVNEGQLQAWNDALKKGNLGVGMVKRWILTPDDRLCPLCKQMVGQQVQIEQPFLTPLGPIQRPPMHPNCRCAMGLVRGKPTMGKGVPQTGPVKPPTSTLSKPKPKTFPAAPSRAFPAPPKPAVPPDPPYVQKLKTLGVTEQGKLQSMPGPTTFYDERPWKAVISEDEWDALAAKATFDEVPVADLQYVIDGYPNVSSIEALIEGGPFDPASVARYQGKLYTTNPRKALAAWSQGEATMPAKIIDLDEALFAKTPEGKIKKLLNSAGEIEPGNVPLATFTDTPFDASKAIDDLGDALTSGGLKLDAVDVPLTEVQIPAGSSITTASPPKAVSGQSVLDLVQPDVSDALKPTVIEWQGQYYAVSQQPKLIAEWAKGSQTVSVRVFKYDEWVAQHSIPAKIDALGVDTLGSIKDLPLPVVSETGGLPPSAVKKLTGKIKTAGTTTEVKVGDLTFGHGMHVNAASTKAQLDLIDQTAEITVRKVGGKLVVTNTKDAEIVVGAWAKEVPTVKVYVQDWDQAYADLKAYNNANSAKSLAKKKAGKQAGASVIPADLQPTTIPPGGFSTQQAINQLANDDLKLLISGEFGEPGVKELANKALKLSPAQQKQVAEYVIGSPDATGQIVEDLKFAINDALKAGPAAAPPPMPAPGITTLYPSAAQWFENVKQFYPNEVAQVDGWLATVPTNEINAAWTETTTVAEFKKKMGALAKKYAPPPPAIKAANDVTGEMVEFVEDWAYTAAEQQPIYAKAVQLTADEQAEAIAKVAVLAPDDDAVTALSQIMDEMIAAKGKVPLPQPVAAPPTPPPPVIPKPPAASKAVRGPAIDDIAFKQVGPQAGSNAGGVFEAKDGSKWYVKFYSDADQGLGEHLANSIYNDLSLSAPTSVAGKLADGRNAFASKFFDDVVTTIGKQSGGMTAAQADRILDGFATDVLTANWEAVGTGLDNVIVRANGQLTRVDQGGTFLFRAKAGKKPTNLLEQITEWEGFADASKNPYYAQVFAKAGISSAEDLGKRIIQQIDNITNLERQYGTWSAYVKAKLPDATLAQRNALVKMLDARSRLLRQKADEIKAALTAAKLPPPPLVTKSGALSFSDAVANSVARRGRGSAFAWDEGDVELLTVRTRVVNSQIGNEWTEFKFKLTDPAGKRMLSEIRAGSRPAFQKLDEIVVPDADAAVGGQATVNFARKETFFSTKKGETFQLKGTNLDIRFHVAQQGDGPYALHNTVQIFVKGKQPTQAEFHRIMEQYLGIASAEPPATSISAVIENSFIRLFQTGVEDLGPVKRRELITKIKREWGVGPEDVRMVRGSDVDRPMLEWTDAAWNKIRQKTRVTGFNHSFNGSGSDIDIMESIFANEQGSFLSTVARQTEGFGGTGMSSSADMRTGGADSFFLHPVTSGSYHSGTPSQGNVRFKDTLMKRLDYHAYSGDTYGATNPHDPRFGSQVRRKNTMQSMIGGSGEVMMRRGISFDDVEAVYLSNTIRQELIKRLRKRGISVLGGRPIETFFKIA